MGKQIILASASSRRISLLKKWGLSFKTQPSKIKENTNLKRPHSIVKDLSYKKCKAVSDKNPNSIVLSADTLVVLGKIILGKPKDKKESEKMIRMLNGSFHKVYTGVSIIDNTCGRESVFYDCALIKARKLPESSLIKLFGKHIDKAGGYAVQNKNDNFIEKIYGDYYTVVGLPYKKLKAELKNFKIKI
jgi:septum formation protein